MKDLLRRLWRRISFRWRRAQLGDELAEELEFHRSLKQREHLEAGLSADAAASLAKRQMGNMTQAIEESREAWGFLALERLAQDLRYALRVFGRNPGFTAVAVVSLALGIGGNTAVFSFVNALLLRPLPYSEPDRLVRVDEYYPKGAVVFLQEQGSTMNLTSASPGSEFNLIGEGEAVRLLGSNVSVNLLSVLGANPLLGRGFQPGEDRPGTDGVVLLSHALWSTKFGADPGVLGLVISLNGVDRQVVGVMPPWFDYPSPKIQLWIPLRLDPGSPDYWGGEFSPVIGRLEPGINLEQAQSEIRALAAPLHKAFPFPLPADWNRETAVIPLKDDLVAGVRGKLLLLLSSVGMVLLIGCANVASLLLSRASVRREEIALRAALGAGRGRILRQLLTESVLLSAIGGGLGILLGMAALSVFRAVLPNDTPGLGSVAIDYNVLAFAAGLAVVTGIVFGIAPALNAARVDLTESIKAGGRRSSSAGSAGLRSWLIGAEIALTVVLVVASGLLIKTLYTLTQVDPGFKPEQLLTVRIAPNQSLCENRTACIAIYGDLLRSASEIAGVSAAALANTIPMDGQFALAAIPVEFEDHPMPPDLPEPMFLAGAVTADYLPILDIPVLAGRGFTSADTADSAKVALVTASTASRFWPGQSPVGKHIRVVWDREWRTVVGVVADVRQYDLTGESPGWIKGAMYLPYAQSVQIDRQLPAAMHLLVKTAADPARVGGELRSLAVSRNPNVPVSEVRAMDALVSDSIANRRSTMRVFLGFAAAALILAAVGVYGLVSYSVSQRTREIGVRMAIGANKRGILKLVLSQSLRIAAAGIAVGMAAAVALTRFLESQLYGVAATDPMTFLAVGSLLFLTTAAASAIPAWRAAQTDLTQSLRVT
jgi:putative ABC transport system permease protein